MRLAIISAAAASIAVFSCADTTTFNDTGAGSDGGGDDAVVDTTPPVDAPKPASLTGVVRAPEGTIPIAGALVYATPPSRPPEPIPEGVYCDECVELTSDLPNTTSETDGTFKLELLPGEWLLVTQKGAFRRVRPISVPATGASVDERLTTLPGKSDPDNGDTIPKMAILVAEWDAIENSLAKLGMGEVDANGNLQRGTESFDMIECELISFFPPQEDCKPVDPVKVFTDYETLSKYQILFVPCGGGGGETHDDSMDWIFALPETKDTVVQWIHDGGRLYVTDWRYDLLQQIMPDYIVWEGQSSDFGTAELSGSYTTPAYVQDQGLEDWLAVQGIVNFDLLESWTVVKTLNQLPTPGPDEKSYPLMPKAWVLGDPPGFSGLRPMTISYQYGCGRVLFSAYHTEGSKSNGKELLPQEKALLYILLEVAVCITPPQVN